MKPSITSSSASVTRNPLLLMLLLLVLLLLMLLWFLVLFLKPARNPRSLSLGRSTPRFTPLIFLAHTPNPLPLRAVFGAATHRSHTTSDLPQGPRGALGGPLLPLAQSSALTHWRKRF
ncbi:hypothetical protein CDAR_201331 [Caerostris darwini]|uniref:Uncharacterized protein n=1 Tax=Caerostris darwini TaxID=1538125 RepID=A0AAV4RYP1_9ARAC|nr:hypothetical protein CDAR_201331 [Caerostris darwini]